jgi:hypothetical protein
MNLKCLIYVGSSLVSPIAEKPLSTPEVETQRPREGIRESRGNELTTKLRVRAAVEGWGKGRDVERNYKEKEGLRLKTNMKKRAGGGGGKTTT